MEDFKNCMLEFVKQQEIQRLENFKRLHESIERQDERFEKLLFQNKTTQKIKIYYLMSR